MNSKCIISYAARYKTNSYHGTFDFFPQCEVRQHLPPDLYRPSHSQSPSLAARSQESVLSVLDTINKIVLSSGRHRLTLYDCVHSSIQSLSHFDLTSLALFVFVHDACLPSILVVLGVLWKPHSLSKFQGSETVSPSP